MLKSIYSQVWCSPRLFRIYDLVEKDQYNNGIYQPSSIEAYGNKIGTLANLTANVAYMSTPLLFMYVALNKTPLNAAAFLGQCTLVWFMVVSCSKVMKYHGRMTSPIYQQFHRTLLEAQQNPSIENMVNLRNFDFEPFAWPATYKYPNKNSVVVEDLKEPRKPTEGLLGRLRDSLAYMCFHGFGRHLIFPGSVALLQSVMEPMLEKGRTAIVTEHRGVRSKINVLDRMEISTMFVDRRRKNKEHGKTLVLCCEGNAGHYEVGVMSTPLATSYSVLGWNHPGFYGSTGCPDDYHERLAVASVMDYAVNELNFKPENILVYAWSIGGYTGAWLAKSFPTLKGVILDATFDHVLPLAIPRMPALLKPMVEAVIERHCNLDVAELLQHYPGPVSIIRRADDEIICTELDLKGSNRANYLLTHLLRFRFPNLTDNSDSMGTLEDWLQTALERETPFHIHPLDQDKLQSELVSYVGQHGPQYPMAIGKHWNDPERKTTMLLFLAAKYFNETEGGHNLPLPAKFIKCPWAPIDDPSYVQVN